MVFASWLQICKVLVVTMTHEEMVDLLRTSDVVAVILIPPLEDGTPRRYVIHNLQLWSNHLNNYHDFFEIQMQQKFISYVAGAKDDRTRGG